MNVTIYHNPKCTKSRQTLELLTQRGLDPQVVEYLKDPPDKGVLTRLLKQLGMVPRELMRSGEPSYKELGLADPARPDDELIDAMCAHPELIQRPIVVVDDERAAIGRPPEQVLKIL